MQDARRWVVDTCLDIDRPELVECAELGTSELVTNALLHADPPISVRVRGTREHPRVEVRDGSTTAPQLPSPVDPDDVESLMLTFGLGAVAGPAIAGAAMTAIGPVGFFVYLVAAHAVIALIALYRMTRRAAPPTQAACQPVSPTAGTQRSFPGE